MSRHFGDMLLERRRQMGASIQQVSNIVKIRPQIIEYFETENFAAMPPRGYAQGMISSYARYLGLNPRDVIEAYFDALHEYEHGGGSVGRFQDAAADASPRSSNASGRYMMVNSATTSRFAQRPPQAGYVSEANSSHEPLSSSRLRPATSRRPSPDMGYDPSLRSRTNGREGAYGPGVRSSDAMEPRGGRRARYAGDPHDPRRAAYGQQRSRSNAYGDPRRGNGARGGGRPPRSGGAPHRAPQPSFDPRIVLAAGAILLLLIVLCVTLLLRGCTPKEDAKAGSSTPSTSQVDTGQDDGTEDMSSSDFKGDASQDSEGSGTTDAKDSARSEPTETVVKVALKEKGTVAWVEVKLDGKIVLGKQVVGPFEQEFTVSSQIDITMDSPSDVAVYKNGEKVRYDTKVSGVGKVSITAPQTDESDEKVVDSDGDGTPDMTAAEAKEAGITVSDGSSSSESQ